MFPIGISSLICLEKFDIQQVLAEPEVKDRCQKVLEQNKKYKVFLKEYTQVKGHVAITDFRSLKEVPTGNRFLVYSLFPETITSVRIRYDIDDKGKVLIGVGHSIFNQQCKVNVGLLLSQFEGGGHRGAGACKVHVDKAEDFLSKIVSILLKNESNENRDV